MKKNKNKLITSILLFLGIIISTSCSKDDPKPYYEVIPIVEVYNPFFDDVQTIRLHNTLSVDGISTTTTWDIEFHGVRFGCGMLKWHGEKIEYIVGTELEFKVDVLYKLIGETGFTPIENLADGNFVKKSTWIRPYFEVRDKNKPSNKFLGIEEWSNPIIGEYQAPKVIWIVTDLNTIPSSGGISSPTTSSRVSVLDDTECPECIWTQTK